MGLLCRAGICRRLCALPRSAPRRLRLPLCSPSRRHHEHTGGTRPGRISNLLVAGAGPQRQCVQSPETRGMCTATAQILAVLKSWQKSLAARPAADDPAAGGGAAQIVSEGEKQKRAGGSRLVAPYKFFPKFEGPGRLRVDLMHVSKLSSGNSGQRAENPGTRSVSECFDLFQFFERKLESKRLKSRTPECLGMSRAPDK